MNFGVVFHYVINDIHYSEGREFRSSCAMELRASIQLVCSSNTTFPVFSRQFIYMKLVSLSDLNYFWESNLYVFQTADKVCSKLSADFPLIHNAFWKLVMVYMFCSIGFSFPQIQSLNISLLSIICTGEIGTLNLKGWCGRFGAVITVIGNFCTSFFTSSLTLPWSAHLNRLNLLPDDGCMKCLWGFMMSSLVK